MVPRPVCGSFWPLVGHERGAGQPRSERLIDAAVSRVERQQLPRDERLAPPMLLEPHARRRCAGRGDLDRRAYPCDVKSWLFVEKSRMRSPRVRTSSFL